MHTDADDYSDEHEDEQSKEKKEEQVLFALGGKQWKNEVEFRHLIRFFQTLLSP